MRINDMMEFVRSSDDFCAGYLQEDSDLEFSDCSEEVRYFTENQGSAVVKNCAKVRNFQIMRTIV